MMERKFIPTLFAVFEDFNKNTREIAEKIHINNYTKKFGINLFGDLKKVLEYVKEALTNLQLNQENNSLQLRTDYDQYYFSGVETWKTSNIGGTYLTYMIIFTVYSNNEINHLP